MQLDYAEAVLDMSVIFKVFKIDIPWTISPWAFQIEILHEIQM